MMSIPEELLEQIERGNVVLFIGEQVVCDAEGQPALDRLATCLSELCDMAGTNGQTFPEVAQAYEDQFGRHALVQRVREQLEALGDETQPVHRLIAELTVCDVLVTTCVDRGLEQAFNEAGRPLDVIIRSPDVAFVDERKAQLYKLRGSLEQAESLILTDDDYETCFDDQASISVVLQGYLARRTTVFIGYDMADPHFRRLYGRVITPLDKFARRSYAFGIAPSPTVKRWAKRKGIQIGQAEATTFLKALNEQLAAGARAALAVAEEPAVELPAPLPERPYKRLDYYEAKDAAIFFGRRQETQTLSSLVHAHRLVVLHGASGTGKTSLLLAGVVPRLERAEPAYDVIYARALGDPALAIRHALQRRLPEVTLRTDASLVDLCHHATEILGHTLVIILDQFEEFFIRLSPLFRAAFTDELGALYDARDIRVKVVLSLRDDWLASVSEFEGRIPEVFRTRMRLLPLDQNQARRAITAPVERLGASYEPALVDRLLSDLTAGEGIAVFPPQLQLVCSALYDALESDEQRITLTAYDRLGGARGVLQRYLDDELARLDAADRAMAHAVLVELVTSQGTKAVKTLNDLAFDLDAEDLLELWTVLDKLVRARLLRVLEREDGATAYELSHEYLIREIGLEPEVQRLKQTEELLRQEVANWKRFETLLSADKLDLISESVRRLRLSDEAQVLILRSALVCGHNVGFWLRQLRDTEPRFTALTQTMVSNQPEVRRRAAEAFATLDSPDVVEPLVTLALLDAHPSVRLAARSSLARLVWQLPTALARLQQEMEGADGWTRRAILETFAVLPTRSLPVPLRARIWATELLLPGAPYFGWIAACVVVLPIALRVARGFFENFIGRGGSGALYGLTWADLEFLMLFAAVIGVAQWTVFRRSVRNPTLWLLGSVSAGTAGWFLGLLGLWISGVMGWISGPLVFGAVLGAAIGTTQWILIRRHIAVPGFWPLVSIVGVSIVTSGAQVGNPLLRGSLPFLQGALLGAISGFVLLWLYRHFRSAVQALSSPGFALLLGLLVWGVAADAWLWAKDPWIERSFASSIPVVVINQPAGTHIVEGWQNEVQVRIRAQQSLWEDLREEDFRAVIDLSPDLSPLGPGAYLIPVAVHVDVESVTVVEFDPEWIEIELEEIRQRAVPVWVETTGEPARGFYPRDPVVLTDTVNIRGPSSQVDRVHGAVGTVALTDTLETVEDEIDLIAVDVDGRPVTGVTLDPARVFVSVPVEQLPDVKFMSVVATRLGQPAEGYHVTDVGIEPPVVGVRGPVFMLDDLPGFLTTVPISIEGHTEDIVERLLLELPPGFSMFEPARPAVEVTVGIGPDEQGFDSVTVTRTLIIQGLHPGLMAVTSPEEVEVILYGPRPRLSNLLQGVHVILDLSDLRLDDEVLLEPVVISTKDITVESIIPSVVHVQLISEPAPPPTP